MTGPEALPTAGPIAPGERLETLDVLRGFALLVIFSFNVFIFSGALFMAPETAHALPTYRLDRVADYLRLVLFENKGFSLFALVFGVGFGLMARRAESAGRSFVPQFLRRQGVLLVIGLLHASLLFGGDILVIYAIFGLVLLPFLRRSSRTVLTAAALIYPLPILLYALTMVFPMPSTYQVAADWTGVGNLYGIWMDGFTQGGFLQVIQGNLAFLSIWWTMFVLNFYWPDVIALFLLGLYVGRSRWVERLEANPSLIPGKWVVWAGIVGLAGNIAVAILMEKGAYEPPSAAGLLLTAIQYTAGVPTLCFFYVAGLLWLLRRPAWKRALRPVAAAGRMTLTNYLMQSLLCVFVFYGVGLGLFGKVGSALTLGLAWAIYLLQLALSTWWWSRGFTLGPIEWVWRRLTYGASSPGRVKPVKA